MSVYKKQNWIGLPSRNTPLSPDRLDHLEEGITEASLAHQSGFLNKWKAGLASINTSRVNVLVPADSMTLPWSRGTGGIVASWLEQLESSFREYGPTTQDWRPAMRPAFGGESYTTTGTVGTHGFGSNGVVLDPGEYWQDTFGGETIYPGDAVAVYVTQQATNGANVRVLIDGVEVLAPVTTTNATPSAVLGHTLVYESPAALDGKTHTVRVEASGSGTVKLDGILVHHGTLTKGLVLWNGGLNGSTAQVHIDLGGFRDALKKLDSTLYLVILPSGLATYISDTSGASYISGQTNAINLVKSETKADILIVHQYEPSGFVALSNTWANWGTKTYPMIRELAADNGCAFVSVYEAVGTTANQALTSKNVDIWTWSAPISGGARDYLHTNMIGQSIIADTIWPVLSQSRDFRSYGLLAQQSSIAGSKPISDNGATVASTVTETTLLASPMSIPANTLAAGDLLKLEGLAIGLSFSGSPVTVRHRVKVGGVAVFDKTVTSIAAGASAAYMLNGRIYVKTIGAVSSLHVDIGIDLTDTASANVTTGYSMAAAGGTALTSSTEAPIAIDWTIQMGGVGVAIGAAWVRLGRSSRF